VRSVGPSGWLVLALTLLAFVLYGVADARPGVMLLALLVGTVGWWSGYAVGRGGLSPFVSWALVAGALGNAVRTTASDGLDVTDFCEFIILIQLIKLFDRRGPRDDAQVITLNAFLAIGATLLSPALAVGGLLLAFLPLLILTAMRYQIDAGLDEAARAAKRAGAGAVHAALGHRTGVHLVRTALVALIAGLVVSAAIFLIMPRGVGGSPMGGWTPAATRTTTGFTDRVQLGGQGVISESSVPVLDIEIRNTRGESLGGPEAVHYLRGAVLDEYRDGTWRASTRSRPSNAMFANPGRPIILFDTSEERPEVVQRVRHRAESRARTPMFSIWRPTSVRMEHRGQLSWGAGAGVLMYESESGDLEYEIRSVLELDHTPATEANRTIVSFESRVVRDLATRILTEGGISPDPTVRPYARDREAAALIEAYLRREHGYSLQMRRPSAGADPIEWFLAEQRPGHCEYFASSMTAMCRSVGINARVVTGYVAVEFNPSADRYTVRERNAHAWVEVELAPRRWDTFDPTPPTDLRAIHRPELGLTARIGRAVEALEYAWIRSVIGYDRSMQLSLFGRNSQGGSASSDDPTSERTSADNGPRLARVLGAGAIGVAALILTWRVWASLRRRQHAASNRIDPAEAWANQQASFYPEMLSLLESRGLAKPDSDPPWRYARVLARRDPESGGIVQRVASLYYKARFGASPLDPRERQLGRLLVAQLRERLDLCDAPHPSEPVPATSLRAATR